MMWISALQTTINVFLRFHAGVAICTGISCILVLIPHLNLNPKEPAHDPYFKTLMLLVMAFPVFLSIRLFGESSRLRLPGKTLVAFLALTGLVGIWLTVLAEPLPNWRHVNYTRYLLLNLGLYISITFAPFVHRSGMISFWCFNKSLLLRLLRTALFSGVLSLGLCLCLFSVSYLFKVRIKEFVYADLLAVIFGLLAPCFFLAGVPEDPTRKPDVATASNTLRVFLSYVLIPLIAVYSAILYAYSGKILLQWRWPKGGVAMMITAFSLVSTVGYGLAYPFHHQSTNSIIDTPGHARGPKCVTASVEADLNPGVLEAQRIF